MAIAVVKSFIAVEFFADEISQPADGMNIPAGIEGDSVRCIQFFGGAEFFGDPG